MSGCRLYSQIIIVYIVFFQENYRSIITDSQISIFNGAEALRTIRAEPLHSSIIYTANVWL